jgi:hypothetical protein
MAVLVLAFPMCSLFAVSFGIPFRTPNLTYARRFDRTQWPHDEMLRVIGANSRPKVGERERILVGVDRATLNANNIELSVTARQLPFTVETTAYEDDLNIVFNRLDQASYFLYEEGGSGESAFNQHTAELIKRVAAARQFTEIPYGRRLPDGGVVRIFKNSAASRPSIDASFVEAGSPLAEDFHVDFGGMLMLTSLSTSKTTEAISVGCQWRCLKPPDREYWCFAHLIDAAGRTVSQFDHRLLGGDPPVVSWRSGDGGKEQFRIRVPTGFPSSGLRLRLGLYDPQSGERLRIGSLEGEAASRFTSVDQSTALLATN